MADSATPDPQAPRGRRWGADEPPAPVLPPTHGRGVGRHFSADELPDDWESPLPRRSAATPTEWWPDADAPQFVPSPAPATPPTPTPGAAARGTTPTRANPPARDLTFLTSSEAADTPTRPRWLWPAVGVGGLALVAALGVPWLLGNRAPAPAPTAGPTASDASPSPAAAAPGVLTPETAAMLRPASWSLAPAAASTEQIRARQANLRCAALNPDAEARLLQATGAEPVTVYQQVERYPTVEAAQQAFATRSAELGGCTATPDLLQRGFAVAGLGDQATGVQVLQQGSGLVHQVLALRSGTSVVVTDAQAGATAVPADALARALAATLPGPDGASPAPLTVTAGQPAPGASPGFLTPGDLPQATPGTGQWVGAQIKPLALQPGVCEQAPLTAPPGATVHGQQAFVLTNDPKAPEQFGLDELVYSFGTPETARAFAESLTTQLTTCPQRLKTATVRHAGGPAAPAYGASYIVEDRKTLDSVARSRVLVASVGSKAVYVRANPTPAFDLSDQAWVGVLQRALDRAQQVPA